MPDGSVGAHTLSGQSDRVMRKNFHESFAGGEGKGPSERATGLVCAAVALIVAVLWRNNLTVLWVARAHLGNMGSSLDQ